MDSVIVIQVLTIIIAIMTTTVAYMQYKTTKNQLKYSLYDKRYQVYVITKTFLDHMITDEKLDNELFKSFIIKKNESAFLFDKDIYEKLEIYFKITHEFQSYRNLIASEKEEYIKSIPDWVVEIINESKPLEIRDYHYFESKIKTYFKQEFFNLESLLMEYLNFHNI